MSDNKRAKKAFNRACERQLVIRDIPMHKDTIYGQYIDAGWLLSKMDLAGGKRAFDYVRGRAVTVGIEAMAFHKPVKVGDQVSIYTEVVKQGNSSLAIKVESWAQERGAQQAHKVTEGLFTFVSIDDKGKPKPIDGKLTSACHTKPASKGDCCKTDKKESGSSVKKAKVAKSPPGNTSPPPLSSLNLMVPATDNDKNYLGDIFGGWLLSKMDLACSAVAKRRANMDVATVALDAMTFHKPVKVGDTVRFYAKLENVGRTSLSVSVEAWAERKDKTQEKVTEGTFTYVAFNKNRKPSPIQPK